MAQVNRIVGSLVRARRAWMKGGTRESWVRRARPPSLPTPQLRMSVLDVSVAVVVPAASGGVDVEVGLQMIVPSNASVFTVLVVPMKMVLVGRIRVACSSSMPVSLDACIRLSISVGRSSSVAPSSCSECCQNSAGVRP